MLLKAACLFYIKTFPFYIPNIPTFHHSRIPKKLRFANPLGYDNYGHLKDCFRTRAKIHHDHNIGRIC